MDFRRTICDYQLLPADLRGQIMEMPYAFVKAFHWHTLVLAMSKHLVSLYEDTRACERWNARSPVNETVGATGLEVGTDGHAWV